MVGLGMQRVLTDLAYSIFLHNLYILTKTVLVRIANTKFAAFEKPHGVHVLSFTSKETEFNDLITGFMKQSITLFLWPALFGLQPNCYPDEYIYYKLPSSLIIYKF